MKEEEELVDIPSPHIYRAVSKGYSQVYFDSNLRLPSSDTSRLILCTQIARHIRRVYYHKTYYTYLYLKPLTDTAIQLYDYGKQLIPFGVIQLPLLIHNRQ